MRRQPFPARRCQPPPPPAEGRREAACGGFSLVELLVVISIIITLVLMTGAAVSAARTSQKRQATQALIAKLDAIISQQFGSYGSRVIPEGLTVPSGMTAGTHRAWYIRRHMINGDLPDRWVDVKYMADHPADFTSPTQRAYIASWNANATQPTDSYQGAECLFMIIMQGGIASCVDCNELQSATKGDKDEDGFFEFWDAWGNPIAFLLWPSAVELPAGTGTRFFSGPRPLEPPFPTTGPSPSPSLGMRPLIYSAGADGEYGFETQAAVANLSVGTNPVGRDCGNWEVSPASLYGGPAAGGDDHTDNLTNLDAEAMR